LGKAAVAVVLDDKSVKVTPVGQIANANAVPYKP
jgi:hypothetical protein